MRGNVSQERLRLLLLVNSIAVGGMEEHVELLARHLDRRRFEVFAVMPEWEPLRPFAESLASAADHFALITPDLRHGSARLAVETLRLARQLKEWQIDVAHMHSTTYRGQYYAFLAAKAAGVRKIFVTEHLAPDAPLSAQERIKRDLFTRMITGVVCVSRKNYLARKKHLYTPEDRTTVVNNGVDLDDFVPIPSETLEALRSRHDLADSAQVVGTAVRFEPEKGLDNLVDAMPKIRAECPAVHFLMVGDGSLRGELAAQVERVGMSDRVRFVGFQKDPRPYLALMDAFVLPVPVGSMSIGLLEAMAMGCAPVITFGGEGEAVVHGETGFCAEPRNPDSIAKHVIGILKDPQLKERLGQAARKRVEAEFSAQQVARSLEKLYA
jgi:glycogen synthase